MERASSLNLYMCRPYYSVKVLDLNSGQLSCKMIVCTASCLYATPVKNKDGEGKSVMLLTITSAPTEIELNPKMELTVIA
jgi:hypothetical protein